VNADGRQDEGVPKANSHNEQKEGEESHTKKSIRPEILSSGVKFVRDPHNFCTLTNKERIVDGNWAGA